MTKTQKSDRATTEDVKKLAEKHDLKLKRIYRKPEDRPFPELAGNDEKNRLKKQFKMRIDPDILEKVNDAAKEQGLSRQEWVEGLILKELSK